MAVKTSWRETRLWDRIE